MPYNTTTGIYTAPTGATNAAPGNVIRSGAWNTIFTDIQTALTQIGPGAFAPADGAAFVKVTPFNHTSATDLAVVVPYPPNASLFLINAARIANPGATLTSSIGLFTAVSQGGTTLVAPTNFTLIPGAGIVGNNLNLALSNNTIALSSGTLYYHLGTVAGSLAVTTDVQVSFNWIY